MPSVTAYHGSNFGSSRAGGISSVKRRKAGMGWSLMAFLVAALLGGSAVYLLVASQPSRKALSIQAGLQTEQLKDVQATTATSKHGAGVSILAHTPADFSSAFQLYYGYKGNCAAGLILALPGSSLRDTQAACFTNPNCTFFSYHVDQGGIICSGRDGSKISGRIRLDEQPEQAGWISGDRRGCQQYALKESRIAARMNVLPVCYKPKASGCPLFSANGRCITDTITHVPARLALTDMRGQEAICVVDGVLTLQSQSALPAGAKCHWLPASFHGRTDFINPATRQYLFQDFFPDTADSGVRLMFSDHCLCDNPMSGLAIGPWCGNADCVWHPAESSCLARAAVTGHCLADMLSSSMASRLKCVCRASKGLGIANGKTCTSPACTWLDPAAITRLVTQQLNGNLVAMPRRCMCEINGRLVFESSGCDQAHCQWMKLDSDVADSLHPLAGQFVLNQHTKLQCVVQLMQAQQLASLGAALQLCLQEPRCTALVYNRETGGTLICDGVFKDADITHGGSNYWVSAVRKGCGMHTDQLVLAGSTPGTQPACYERASCSSCPPGQHMVQPCTADGPAICDTTTNGYAGVFPGSQVIDAFQEPLQALARSLPHPEYRSFNPSVFAHHGKLYVVFRMANNTLCNAEAFGDQKGKHYYSRLGLCLVQPVTYRAYGCREVHFDPHMLPPPDQYLKVHPVFRGLEDPRGFSFNGTIYISATVSMWRMHSRRTAWDVATIAIARLSDSLDWLDNVRVLQLPHVPRAAMQKNWAALVAESELHFVTQLHPLQVVKLDDQTGLGRLHATAGWSAAIDIILKATAGVTLRGGSPFIYTPMGPLAIAHRRKDFALGPIYTHHFVLLSGRDNGGYIIQWISDGFRLPELLRGSNQLTGIQFATGLALSGSDLLVSFGAADCHAVLARVPQFLTWLHAAASQSGMPLPLAQPLKQLERHSVRWEGIASDFSSLAIVTREMSSRIMYAMPTINYDIHDLASTELVPMSTAYPDLDKVIIRTNAKLNQPPTLLIRLHWPPNFAKPLARHWVQYLPWEFESIPDVWVAALNANASEVWVPSKYVQQGFVRSGLDPGRVRVVPHGVGTSMCSGGPPPARLPWLGTAKSFTFLYQGGALWRKGLDILLAAYEEAFTADDDVTLVLHVSYGTPDAIAYVNSRLISIRANHAAPHILALPMGLTLTNEQNTALYHSVSAYVHPARAEGYGLTVLQAMASGRPVIVSDIGGQADFTSNTTAFLVPARMAMCRRDPCHISTSSGQPHRVFDWAMSQPPRWAEMASADLGSTMRYVMSSPLERQKRAQAARKYVCSQVTWAAAAEIASRRLEALLDSPAAERSVKAPVEAVLPQQ